MSLHSSSFTCAVQHFDFNLSPNFAFAIKKVFYVASCMVVFHKLFSLQLKIMIHPVLDQRTAGPRYAPRPAEKLAPPSAITRLRSLFTDPSSRRGLSGRARVGDGLALPVKKRKYSSRKAARMHAPRFPAILPRDKLEALRIEKGQLLFACQYLNQPIPTEHQIFKLEIMHKVPKSEVNLQRAEAFAFCEPEPRCLRLLRYRHRAQA